MKILFDALTSLDFWGGVLAGFVLAALMIAVLSFVAG